MGIMENLPLEQQTNVLLKYLPDETPSPRVWLELVKTQVLGVDKHGQPRPVEDLLFFLSTCHRSQLDPLARQIYAVYRWDSRAGREKMTVQVSIDGMRLIAQRSGAYGGQDDARFLPEDESAEHPTKATVTVYRLNSRTGERMPVTASARWSEYAPYRDGNLTGLWSKMPYLMLAKVAEALALRKAFPQELSGLYSRDEMEQDGGQIVDATARRLPTPAESAAAALDADATQAAAPASAAQPAPAAPPAAPDPEPEPPAPPTPTPAPAPAQTSAPTVANGTPGRPWTAEQVIRALRQTADYGTRHPDQVEVNGRYGAAIGLLDKISKDADHHLFIKAVWGVESAKDLVAERKWALTRWADPFKPTPDDPWQLPQHVCVEFVRVVNDVLHPDTVPF